MKYLPYALLVVVAGVAIMLGLWVKSLKGLLAEANSHIVAAGEVITKQKAELELIAKTRRLPVKLALRKEAGEAKGTLELTNVGDQDLPLVLKLSNDTFPDGKSFEFVIKAGASKNLSSLEGWTAATGDMLELNSEGYPAARVKVNLTPPPAAGNH